MNIAHKRISNISITHEQNMIRIIAWN